MNATTNALREVLVLEDDQDQRELSQELLEMKTGAEIEAVPSADEVENWDYDVIVTDYTGIDLETVYDNADDDVILYTGHDREFMDVPDDVEYIMKGGGYDELAEAVDRHL